MKRKKADIALLAVSIAGFSVMSASFLLMDSQRLGKIPGLLFWLGLAVGAGCQIALAQRRRALFSRYQVKPKAGSKPGLGLIGFFTNTPAKVADIGLGAGLVGTVLSFWLTEGLGYSCYLFLAVTVLAFSLHCVFNGRLYHFAMNQESIRHMLELRKVRKTSKGDGKNEK